MNREPSVKKRPIPQPRKAIPSSREPEPQAEQPPQTPSKDSSLSKSLRNLIPEAVKSTPQPVPVPTAQFKSFRRANPTPEPTTPSTKAPAHPPQSRHSSQGTPKKPPAPAPQSNMPDYINTTPPVIPERKPSTQLTSTSTPPPPTKPKRVESSENIPMPTMAPPPRPVKPAGSQQAKRSPSKSKVDPSALVAHSRSSSSGDSSSGNVSPYYVSDLLNKDASHGEAAWAESLKAGASKTSSPLTQDTPPRLPQRPPGGHPVGQLRSAGAYHPIPVPGETGEESQLRYAFAMDLGRTGGEGQAPATPVRRKHSEEVS